MKTNVYDGGQAPAVAPLTAFGQPPSQKPKAPAKAGSATWLIAALLLLSAIPLAAGAFRLEIAKQYPDVHLSPGYEFDQGDSKWSLGLTVDLPVLNQNQGPIAEAKARRAETGARFLALQTKVLAEIDRALALVETDSQTGRLLGSVAREQARRQDSLAAQFKAGAVDRLELLNAQVETATAQLAEVDGQFRLQRSIGALESALQRELPPPATIFV